MRAETVAPLVDLLRGLAQVQARLPTLHDLAELLDLSPSRTRALLAEARQRRMIIVHRGKNGVDWAAVEAALRSSGRVVGLPQPSAGAPGPEPGRSGPSGPPARSSGGSSSSRRSAAAGPRPP